MNTTTLNRRAMLSGIAFLPAAMAAIAIPAVRPDLGARFDDMTVSQFVRLLETWKNLSPAGKQALLAEAEAIVGGRP
jgi:hypothetical protein